MPRYRTNPYDTSILAKRRWQQAGSRTALHQRLSHDYYAHGLQWTFPYLLLSPTKKDHVRSTTRNFAYRRGTLQFRNLPGHALGSSTEDTRAIRCLAKHLSQLPASFSPGRTIQFSPC